MTLVNERSVSCPSRRAATSPLVAICAKPKRNRPRVSRRDARPRRAGRVYASSTMEIPHAIRPRPIADRRRGRLTWRRCLSFHAIHGVTGRDDRSALARAVVGVALLHAVGADERDAEITIHVRSDDGLVVAGDGPCERLFRVGDGGRRAPPSKPALLPFHRVSCLDVAHARRIGGRLRSGMMVMGAEDDRFPFPDHVPLRSGIASCARVDVAAAPRSANAKTRCLIASSPVDDRRRRPVKSPAIILQAFLSQASHTPNDPC